ncbi:LAFE_0A05072g1_1 [Lachancea fermentati]|uniref:LAFE_0A05072g1_1 n=1 Tax=Lachancea fermentati TaxID=4955 RepID=A0A1G4M701_LACFM|nr:LAFE_0A05072g1_1 [Lachancea fermentati]
MGALNSSTPVSDVVSSSKASRRGSTALPNVVVENSPGKQVVDIVSRHLVQPSDEQMSASFNSLQLQGGDITRELYRWQDQNVDVSDIASARGDPTRRRRSMSFTNSVTSHGSLNPPEMSADEIRAPQGFRRSFIVQKRMQENREMPNFMARNFIEFLTLYGHFAGQDLSDDEDEEEEVEDEESALLSERIPRRKHRKPHEASVFKAVLLLLKAFVGTGVLFLPRAFHNGGWAFSTVCLLFCGVVSFYCFLLLINTKDKLHVNGYGDLGAAIYGPTMRYAILGSVVLSQIGFVAAYAVFTATNLQVFFANVFNWNFPMSTWLLAQLLFYIPLSLTRSIAKLSSTALLADLFIVLGLLYVYYYSGQYVVQHGIAAETMLAMNKDDWTLFIGTAIFTYEGIGLLIPIQESMKQPEKFSKCLLGVMLGVSVAFISCGLLCYSAFGSSVKTVILLNFPEDSILTASVELLYALAIMLSTPLQLFPTIRILETSLFPKNASGKHNPRVKWMKNYFRVAIVLANMFIAWIGANDLDKFVSLVGSFACIPLIYIYPPLLHYKAFSHGGASKLHLVLDQLIAWFGVLVLIYTSYQAVRLWIS